MIHVPSLPVLLSTPILLQCHGALGREVKGLNQKLVVLTILYTNKKYGKWKFHTANDIP